MYATPVLIGMLAIFLVLYGSMYRPKMPDIILNLYRYNVIKALHVFLLAYFANKDITLGLFIALIYIIILNSSNDEEIKEKYINI